ncbi:hypothetical protein LPJ53_002630 [Coemansia erecta]|uniref:Metallo-dependent phosphatase n=1 Tax=Coemansia erecta TaxID=147472 RepID=A0A9W8CTN5_9FUNG|nr:hypothetical protein LPJ53_002630 [Coemansia erecta]
MRVCTAFVFGLVIVSAVFAYPLVPASKQDTDPSSSLRIIHTNDIHAHYSPFNRIGNDCSDSDISKGNCYGGAARLVTTINKLRDGHPNSLLFDAGDQAQGTLFYTLGKFNTTIEVMNELRYDAMCIGNHEFDDGPDFLATFFENISFPAICANIDTSRNANLAKVVRPYIVIDKHKLGVIGYITNTTGSISKAGPTVSFSDAATAVNKYVKVLRQKGIKRIIAVSHNGYHEDMDVAANTHGLDLIVGGHSHTYLALNASEPGAGGLYPTAVKNLDGRTTYVVQAKAWGEYVGYVDINFNSDGSVASLAGMPIHMTQEIAEDPVMASNIAKWRKPFDTYGNTVVGNLTVDVSNAGCKENECALGDLIADAMLWTQNQIEQTDIALINGGAIRAGLAAGTVKVKDLILVSPFNDALTSIKLSGKSIRNIVTGVFGKKSVTNGRPVVGFVQISGARIKYHLDASGSQTIVSIEVGKNGTWSMLDDNKAYTVVTLGYVASGGDNIIDPPLNMPALTALDTAIGDYLQKFSPVTPATDDRIKDTAK